MCACNKLNKARQRYYSSLSLSLIRTGYIPSTTPQRNCSLCRCRHILSPIAIFSLSLCRPYIPTSSHVRDKPTTAYLSPQPKQRYTRTSIVCSKYGDINYVISLQLSNRFFWFAKGLSPYTAKNSRAGLDSGPNAHQARFQPDIHPDSSATGATRLTSAESRLRLFAGESLPTFDLDSGSGLRPASRLH